MLHRHFDSEVKAYPGLCLDIHTKCLMEAPSSEGQCIVFQEHPGAASRKFPRPVSHQLSARASHVDPVERKIPLNYIETILEACSTRGAAIGGGKDWYRVVVRESDYGGKAYYLRVLEQDQNSRQEEMTVTRENLAAIKERIAEGKPLSDLLVQQKQTAPDNAPAPF